MPSWAFPAGQLNSSSCCRSMCFHWPRPPWNPFLPAFWYILLIAFLPLLHPLCFLLSAEAGQRATEPSLLPSALFSCCLYLFVALSLLLSPSPLRAEVSLVDVIIITFMLMILLLHFQLCSPPLSHTPLLGVWNSAYVKWGESLPHSKVFFSLNFFISVKSAFLLLMQAGITAAIFASLPSLSSPSPERTGSCCGQGLSCYLRLVLSTGGVKSAERAWAWRSTFFLS